MGKLEKETRVLLYGIAIVFALSILAAWNISAHLTNTFQNSLAAHDYGVAGYFLNHSDEPILFAFTAEKTKADVLCGSDALSQLGYHENTPIKLLPEVSAYQDQVLRSLFLLLLWAFGTTGLLLFLYLRQQHRVIGNAEHAIRAFLDGNTASRIESGQAGSWYSLFHAVNELTAILSAQAEKEKQTKEFLQGMISDISHQLKTPLSALKMYQEIIGGGDAETAISFSQKSLREIRRMEAVVYTLLKLARLDAGMIQMQKMPENVDTLMRDVLERFEIQAEQESKTITLLGNQDVTLCCDALWLSEAVGNLVKNALEHTESGGHKVSPITAISGNTQFAEHKKSANTSLLPVDTGMGIFHALSDKKNLFLMTCSYAISIMMFLSFQVLVVFLGEGMPALTPSAADLTVTMGSMALDRALTDQINALNRVERAFGRMERAEISVVSNGGDGTVTLISYDDLQLQWAKEELIQGGTAPL